MRPAQRLNRTIPLFGIAVVVTLSTTAESTALEPAGAERWEFGPVLPQCRTAFGCCTVNAGVVIVGGSYWVTPTDAPPNKRWLASVLQLAPEDGEWRQLPDFPTRIDTPLLVAEGNRVYAIGGHNEKGQLSSTYWIDTEAPSPSWRRGPDLPRPLARLRGGTWRGVVYALTDESASPPAASDTRRRASLLAWEPDDPDSLWREVTRAPNAEVCRAATVLGDVVYLFGGATPREGQQLDLSVAVWAYKLDTDTWRRLRSLPYALRDATATPLDGRHILIAGGVEEAAPASATPDGKPRIVLSSGCLVYDTQRDEFSSVEPLRVAVADQGLAVYSGYVLAVGGEDSVYRTRTDLVQRQSVQRIMAGLGSGRGLGDP